MEALVFFVIVFVLVGALVFYLKKASVSTQKDLARKQRNSILTRRHQNEQLATPENNRLSSNEEVWQARRRHVGLVSEDSGKTKGQRYFKYRTESEPEYDGYSRSDRHRVTPAHISEEKHVGDFKL
jgi:hypothetical protein